MWDKLSNVIWKLQKEKFVQGGMIISSHRILLKCTRANNTFYNSHLVLWTVSSFFFKLILPRPHSGRHRINAAHLPVKIQVKLLWRRHEGANIWAVEVGRDKQHIAMFRRLDGKNDGTVVVLFYHIFPLRKKDELIFKALFDWWFVVLTDSSPKPHPMRYVCFPIIKAPFHSQEVSSKRKRQGQVL